MKNQVAFSVRLDLNQEQDHQAWQHLKTMDRKKFRSYSNAVAFAINQFFEPKSDDLVAQLREVIKEEISKIEVVNPKEIQLNIKENEVEAIKYSDCDDALDFADSF